MHSKTFVYIRKLYYYSSLYVAELTAILTAKQTVERSVPKGTNIQ